MARGLRVLTVGPIDSDPELPDWLAGELGRILHVDVFRGPDIALSDDWVDPDTGRFDSNRIVDALIRQLAPADSFADNPEHPRSLAITEVDLVAPGRAFVFGEATLGGPCALISLARLESPDPAVLRGRALKEAVHEFGHMLGLHHCRDPRCVMFASSTLHDTDAKLQDFCSGCGSRHPTSHPP